MKSVKRWLAVTAAATMAITSISGCGKSAGTSSTEAKGEDGKVSFTYWAPLNGSLGQIANSHDDTLYYQELQERLNIDIEFLHPPVGQEGEQFKLMIASGDLPDIIDYSWFINYPGGPEKAITDEIIVPINDYMDRLPNYKAAFERDELNVKEGTTDSGNISGFYTFNWEEKPIKVMQGLMYRADWAAELGLENPETLGDWEAMMAAFKEKKGVEFPLVMKWGDLKGSENFNTAFKEGNSFYLDDDGRVQYGPAQQTYQDYLETLNRWYDTGLLHPDFASLDQAYVDSQVLNGKAGVMYGWIGANLGGWMKAGAEEGFSVEGAANPVMEKGENAFLAGRLDGNLGLNMACISTKAAADETKLDAILKFFDYLYSEEGMILKTYGVEGETFDMVDGKQIYKDVITKNPDGLTMAQALAKYTQAASSGPGYGNAEGYVSQYYQYDTQKTTMKRMNAVVDEVKVHTYPAATVTPEEADELASIMSEVDAVKDEQMTAFIMGVRPLDEYDDFIAELKKLGIDRAVEIKQAALDRFNSR